jgi:hypothetical protein
MNMFCFTFYNHRALIFAFLPNTSHLHKTQMNYFYKYQQWIDLQWQSFSGPSKFLGLFAVGLTATQAWLAWEIWNEQKHADLPIETWAVIIGLVLTFVLSTVSGFMLGGNQPPAGQGLPFVGWHLQKDIRPAHFLAVHAQQLIPLWGLVAARFMESLSTTAFIAGSFLYVLLSTSTWLSL